MPEHSIRMPKRWFTAWKKEYYGLAFVLGCGLFLLTVLPIIIFSGGIFTYYGDFNSQQLPFYHMVQESVRAGELLWNWKTDLGASLIGSYSFYLLGSPFFWLTTLFPTGAVVYLIPILLGIKYGIAALTSYAWIRRFTVTPQAALVGALLYAFSSFQAYNVFFNHFHDVTAFFPLLLLAMDLHVEEGRRGIFAVVVGFMAVLNYYFFQGQVVFCIIYFLFRWASGSWRITLKQFLLLALEAVCGVLLSCFFLLPSLLGIAGNPRTAERLLGQDMLMYNDRTRIPRIIQSLFMIADVPARANLFSSDNAKWASIAAYLPMFSIAGVLAFFKTRGKSFVRGILLLCIFIACVPFVNSLFSGATSSYYARWFYMPILLMAMSTAVVSEDEAPKTQSAILDGFVTVLIGLCIFAFVACVPTKDSDGNIVWGQMPKEPVFIWAEILLTTGLTLLGVWIFSIRKKMQQKKFLLRLVTLTAISGFATTACMVWYGVSIGNWPPDYIEHAIYGGEAINLPNGDMPLNGENFFRVDISADRDNHPMFWGYANMRAFQSTVPASIMEFYPTVDVKRDVASRADPSKYGLRGLFSVKYYFDWVADNRAEDYSFKLPGFSYAGTQNNFDIYENEYFVPMGFTYDVSIARDVYDKQPKSIRDRQLMKGIVLEEADFQQFKGILPPIDAKTLASVSESEYLADCRERAANACDSFSYDSSGFTAGITVDKPNLLFFSVPYDKGFTATVNGKAVDIVKASVGFMAVPVEAGENIVTFSFLPQGLKSGIILSVGGGFLLLIIIFFLKKYYVINNDGGAETMAETLNSNMVHNEDTISSERLFEGKIINLRRDQVSLVNGEKAVREVVEHPGGVCVLPVTEEGDVILVKQFRYPFSRALLEVPAGKLEPGEDHRAAGLRELSEETGGTCKEFTFVGEIYPTVAYDTEIIYLYLATGLTFGEQHLDEDEFVETIKMPFREALDMVMSGEIQDAKTQIAILKYYYKTNNKED